LAEKKYEKHDLSGGKYDFENCLIIVLSSIESDRVIKDLTGRLKAHIKIPALGEDNRFLEIPFVLPMALGKGLGSRYWTPPKQLRISQRFLAALLEHDYQPHQVEKPGTGLDQQNFRALEDILAYSYMQAVGPKGPLRTDKKRDKEKFLKSTHLPGNLTEAVFGVPDDRGTSIVYELEKLAPKKNADGSWKVDPVTKPKEQMSLPK